MTWIVRGGLAVGLLAVAWQVPAAMAQAQAQPQTQSYYGHYSAPFPGPQAYVDPETGATFYVESDGMHLVRIERSGKLTWLRDPRRDAGVKAYRDPDPKIVYMAPSSPDLLQRLKLPAGRFLSITYSNSQFGLIDMRDGSFEFMGQD